ncbi:MAG: hypothetical protein Q6373_016250 [Candidatus Sigynarchaeota archaeon]
MASQPRLLGLDLRPRAVHCDFAGTPAPAVAVPPAIGYLKEMSPQLPISHAVQLRGHWIYPELGEIGHKARSCKHLQ